jgi:hypothetical protein
VKSFEDACDLSIQLALLQSIIQTTFPFLIVSPIFHVDALINSLQIESCAVNEKDETGGWIMQRLRRIAGESKSPNH